MLEIDAIVNSVHGDESPGDFYHISRNSHCNTVADCIYKAGGHALFTELVELRDSPEHMFECKSVVITKGHQLPAKRKLYKDVSYSNQGRGFPMRYYLSVLEDLQELMHAESDVLSAMQSLKRNDNNI